MNTQNTEVAPRPVWLISANDLLLGNLVYLGANGLWTCELAEARKIQDKESATELLESAESEFDSVIGPILVAAIVSANDQIELVHFRDQFRETGPTHRRELSRTHTAPLSSVAHESR